MSRIMKTEVEKCAAGKCPSFVVDMTQCFCTRTSVDVVLERDTELYKIGDADSLKVFKKGATVSLFRVLDEDDWNHIEKHDFPEWCPLEGTEVK